MGILLLFVLFLLGLMAYSLSDPIHENPTTPHNYSQRHSPSFARQSKAAAPSSPLSVQVRLSDALVSNEPPSLDFLPYQHICKPWPPLYLSTNSTPPSASSSVCPLLLPLPAARRADPSASAIELSSEALGGSIVDVSDDFFAAADCLLRVPVSLTTSAFVC